MSRQAWLSLAGLYNYDPSVLDGFRVPEGLSLETAKKKLLLDTIELEFLYPEPETAKEVIKLWTDEEFNIWQKLYNTTILEYNPIWNVDGTVKEIENRGLQRSGNENRNLQSGHNLTETINSESANSGTGTESVTGYNSNTWADHTKNTVSNSERGESERGITEAGTDTGSIDKKDQEEEKITRETVRQGNIGVTSTQQLIKEERESVMFNVYQEIVNSFKRRFCLCVY